MMVPVFHFRPVGQQTLKEKTATVREGDARAVLVAAENMGMRFHATPAQTYFASASKLSRNAVTEIARLSAR